MKCSRLRVSPLLVAVAEAVVGPLEPTGLRSMWEWRERSAVACMWAFRFGTQLSAWDGGAGRAGGWRGS